MWWKIYFWVILITTFVIYSYITSTGSPKIGDLLGLIISIISIIGLYSYVYKKVIFSAIFWKNFFWVFILSDAIYLIYPYTPLNNLIPLKEIYTSFNDGTSTTLIQGLMIMLLLLPLYFPHYYAIYKLGNKK